MKWSEHAQSWFYLPLQKPEKTEWASGLEASKAALELEKHVNQALLDLHKVADTHNDPQVKGWVGAKAKGEVSGQWWNSELPNPFYF